MKRTFAFLFALCLAVAPALAQEEAKPEPKKYELKLMLKKGQVFHYELEQTVDVTMDFGDQTIEQVTNLTMTVAEVTKDGNFKFNVKVDRLRMDMVGMGGEQSMDSDDEDADDEMLDALDAKMTVLVAPDGTVKNVSGAPEIGGAGPGMGGINVGDLARSAFHRLPKDKVALGGSWANPASLRGGMMPINVTDTFTLKSIDQSIVKIDQKVKKAAKKAEKKEDADDEMSEEEEMMAEMMSAMEIADLKGSGATSLDRKSAMIKSKKATSEFIIALESPQGEMELEVSVSQAVKRTEKANTKRTAKKDKPLFVKPAEKKSAEKK